MENYIKFEQYCKERLDDQIEWYSKKSSRNKFWHYTFKILEIIITSAIIYRDYIYKFWIF